jgi:hypothetical protein
MIEELEKLLPAHKASLHLIHNQHKSFYEPITQYLEDREDRYEDVELNRQCIEADSIWDLQWYPNTPVGFYFVYGPTLQSLFDQMKGVTFW